MRAEQVKRQLGRRIAALRGRIDTVGKGSSQNISGLGTDDMRDALDRRVEFKVADCKKS
ncbi:MAG: hypothetical protein R3E48_20350 [Burkholderiaceae bacterium]